MAGRGSVNRQVQVGVETTPGTPVPANKLLPSMSLTITPVLETKDFRAQGFKSTTAVQTVKAFGDVSLTGPLNYTEIVYLLNMLVTGVITTPGGGTLSRNHTFSPVVTGTDAFKTLTIEEGDPTAATQISNAFMPDFNFIVGNGGIDVGGKLNGRSPTVVSLTASPTAIAQLPVSPREVDIYIDPTFGALGTTKVSDGLGLDFGIASKQVMKWVLNTSFQSFKETVEVVPANSFSFTTEHNAQSRAIFGGITGTTNPVQYMRFKATGAIIEAAIPYLFQLDVPVKVKAMAQEDSDGVWAYKYTCSPIYDISFGNKMWEILVRNTITAL
jgi:hypothetical protein